MDKQHYKWEEYWCAFLIFPFKSSSLTQLYTSSSQLDKRNPPPPPEWRQMRLLILTVERQKAVSPPCVWSSGRGRRLPMSWWLAQTTHCTTAQLSFQKRSFLLNHSSVRLFFFCLSSVHFPVPLSLHSPPLHNRTWCKNRLVLWGCLKPLDFLNSQTDKKREISGKEGRYFFLPSFLRHTPMFSFAAQGGEQELARQQGWVSFNWNWLRVVLSSLPTNSSLQHSHTFSQLQMTEDDWLPKCCYILRIPFLYQSRWNPVCESRVSESHSEIMTQTNRN